MTTEGGTRSVLAVDEAQGVVQPQENVQVQPGEWMGIPTHIWIRLAYWWYFSALGSLLTYITLYYQELGFSGLEIGILGTITPIAVAVCAPAWGMIADGFGAHRLVLRVGLLMLALLALTLAQTTNFWLILLINAGMGMFGSPIPAMLDSYSVTIGAQQQRSYGQLRLWGSFGYSVMTWLVGWWMGGSVTAAFLVAYAGSSLLALGSTLGLPRLSTRSSAPAWQGMRTVLGQPAMRVLLVTAFIATSSTGIVFNFFGIYVDALGGSAQLLGAANALSAICELPVLLFGAFLLDRFGSKRVLIFAVALYSLRFAAYTFVPSAPWIMPLQLLHGLTFGAFLMASVTLAYQLVGDEYAATAQGLLSSMSYGFGAIVGSLVGGALLDWIGIIPLYRVATLLMVVALAVLVFGLRMVRPAAQQ